MPPVLRAAVLLLLFLGVAGGPRPAPAEPGTDALLDRVTRAYGGVEALSRAAAVRQTGRLTAAMRGPREGTILRAYGRPDRLRVEIAFPGEEKEVRVLDGPRGWRQGREAAGGPYDAMVLQAARLDLPWLLQERKGQVKELGTLTRDGKERRVLEMPLSGTMTVLAEIDPESGRILRSSGTVISQMGSRLVPLEFATEYDDFRTAGGVLFAFRERNFAQGHPTGDTVLSGVEVLPSLPGDTFRP